MLVTLGILAVITPCGFLWHRRQVHQQADTFVDHANKLAQEGNIRLAAQYLRHYMRLRPER